MWEKFRDGRSPGGDSFLPLVCACHCTVRAHVCVCSSPPPHLHLGSFYPAHTSHPTLVVGKMVKSILCGPGEAESQIQIRVLPLGALTFGTLLGCPCVHLCGGVGAASHLCTDLEAGRCGRRLGLPHLAASLAWWLLQGAGGGDLVPEVGGWWLASHSHHSTV